jgi:SSS family solute:Na+ symporter
MAVVVTLIGGGIFQYVQTLNAFVAPPFAAIFLLGLLWKNANSTGALWAIGGGFFVGVCLKIGGVIFDLPGWFYPFQNQAAIIWISSMVFCIVASKIGKPNRELSEISDILVLENPGVLKEGLGDKWYKSVWLWSAGFFIFNVALMVIFSSVFFPT